MKSTLTIAMTPLDQLGELARAAEEAGFSSIALPDSLEQGDIGVTDIITMPWVFDGLGFDAEVGPKLDSIKKFGDEIIAKTGD
ncbi:hypothetical protein P3102_09390 [Amycolatopsis sp. QT-25]|nr:hypothetical protein [Amycolatopsis sp. QT-25]WET81404.1 hypothetical protein P3102_09390 [Amycolatopsis sp. QT-25]